MSAYLQNLLTNTTSKYTSLRRTLLSSEEDGDTEDDSHITRALRAYYIEKGRPFPPWLPPDPKEVARQQSAQSTQSTGGGYVGQVNAYFGRNSAPSAPTSQPQRPGGGLSDLWGDDRNSSSSAAPQSLRNSSNNRRQGGVQQPSYMSQQAMQQNSSTGNLVVPGGPRPLPSQRAGSYQTAGQGAGLQQVSSGGSSAQDRLKARLWGGGGSQPGSGRSSPQPPGGSAYDRR